MWYNKNRMEYEVKQSRNSKWYVMLYSKGESYKSSKTYLSRAEAYYAAGLTGAKERS